jgi:Na+-transporting NADH:ubiquinone oxidoreductase subunit NqrB
MDIKARLQDPRHYQIAVLGTLVTYGVLALDFGVRPENAVVIVITALLVQFAGTRAVRLPRFDPLSPLITSLSLTLLLRTDMIAVAALAAVIAISSKFLVRVRGKHVFNPANVAIVTLMVSTDHAWMSSGQWGSAAIGALALACLGLIVLTHAKRAETTFGFLGFYALLLFFMISDPKTTPDAAIGRLVYSMLVAGVAFAIQFVLYRPHGPILALIATAPVVPVIDYLFRGTIYRWKHYVSDYPVSDSPTSLTASRIKGVYR